MFVILISLVFITDIALFNYTFFIVICNLVLNFIFEHFSMVSEQNNNKTDLLSLYQHFGVKFDLLSMVLDPTILHCFFWC